MTQLRKRVLEELERRNYSKATAHAYVGAIRRFAEYCFPSISQMKTLRRWQSSSRLRASRTWKCAVPTPQLPILLLTRKSPELAGIVRDYENRKPLRRAELVLTRVDDPRITSHAVADDQGGFRFENLAAGCYDLRISRPGYLPAQVKTLLVPHENSVAVDVPMSRDDKKLIVCQ